VGQVKHTQGKSQQGGGRIGRTGRVHLSSSEVEGTTPVRHQWNGLYSNRDRRKTTSIA
jgi:hypothetical protein